MTQTARPLQIQDRRIGPQEPPFIIAEVAQTHDGSLGNAYALVDAAQTAGADAIKFQTHIASEESTPGEPWRVPFSRQDESRYAYWKRMEFTFQQWKDLKAYADSCGIIFLSSPFSIRACEWLCDIGMAAWKLASGEVHNAQLVEWVAATGQPVIMSSGMSSIGETRALADKLLARGLPLAVLHCTTKYPTPAEDVGLNVLSTMLGQLPVPVGLSDHSGEIFPGTCAVYLGASLLEVHLTLHERMFGPDVPSSLTPDQLAELVRGARFAWQMRQNPVDKDKQIGKFANERRIFGRSLVAGRAIQRGETIAESDLRYKKPGGGLLFEERSQLIGKRAVADIPCDHILKASDVQ